MVNSLTILKKLIPAFLIICLFWQKVNCEIITLAKKGKARFEIFSKPQANEIENFAAQELKKYLDEMSGSTFRYSENPVKQLIVPATSSVIQSLFKNSSIPALENEQYGIFVRKGSVFLVGGNERSSLYAVYHFLKIMGCEWIAPDFSFYEGTGSYIPLKNELIFEYKSDILETPSLKYRKLYVEEGRSHNTENLKLLVDWMAKSRLNTLVFPINYEGNGRVMWENWRQALIPELRKRGIIIEVGGHGYQNFINTDIDNGNLFQNNPEWFGLIDNNRSKNKRVVFCTSNIKAADYVKNSVLNYLQTHPEIEILDFWPPDVEKWCECPDCKALGNESERHLLLVNDISDFIRQKNPDVKLEIIAYSRYTEPPLTKIMDPRILVDFCPINQSFEYQIYDESSASNKYYKDNLLLWKKLFAGDISIYSYYRKYRWRSLPVIIHNYMQQDLQFYRDNGIDGISSYCEPGDWFTYGSNHYVLSNLAWNPDDSVNVLLGEYCKSVYGQYSDIALSIYNEAEDIVRFGCDVAFSTAKSVSEYDNYADRLNILMGRIKDIRDRKPENLANSNNLFRLNAMMEYALKSSILMKHRAENDKEAVAETEKEIQELLQKYADIGVFVFKNN